jgi:D-sedoheptulose 7-phosphate isomerase
MPESHDWISAYVHRSQEALARAAADRDFMATTSAIAGRITECFRAGGKVLFAGNGGSAADAQHIATEFLIRFRFDRNPLPAIALTTDASALTSTGNDYTFDQVFERQLRGLGRAGDVFVGISTSGRSPNVLAALRAARELGLLTVGFTGGSGGPMRELCDLALVAPTDETSVVQQIYMVAGHAICGEVEEELFRRQPAG